MKKKKKTLRKTLLVQTIAILVSAVLLISFISSCFFSSVMTKKVAASRKDVLAQISERILGTRNSIETIFHIYYFNILKILKTYDSSFDDKIKSDFISEIRHLDNISQQAIASANLNIDYAIALNNGYTYASNSMHQNYNLTIMKKYLWYANIAASPTKSVWISTHKNLAQDGTYVFSLAQCLYDVDTSKNFGVFIVDIYENQISHNYKNMLEDNSIYIIDQKGSIISHPDSNMLDINYYHMETLRNLLAEKDYAIIQKKEEKYLLSYYEIENSGWIVMEEIPLAVVLQPLQFVHTILLVISCITLLFGVLITELTVRKTTTPLGQLCKELEKVGRQQKTAPFHVEGWAEIEHINQECNFMSQRIHTLIENAKVYEQEKLKSEFAFMQAQMNPHFVHNTLFSLKCLLDMSKTEEALGMSNAFLVILKDILNYNNEYTYVADELKMIENYIILQKYRYGDIFDYEVICPSELLNKKILRMTLQPLIENSLFHGFNGLQRRGMISLIFEEKYNDIIITLSDNGIGFIVGDNQLEIKSNTKAQFNQIGLHNIKQRMYLYFGNEYEIKINSIINKGTTIIIKYPNYNT